VTVAVSALPLAAQPGAHARPATLLPMTFRIAAVCSLFGAEAIHAGVIQEHIDEWLPIGLFFVGISLIEGILAVALITKPSRRVIRLAIAVSLGTVALWLYTRTAGLPVGPMAGHVEEVGWPDLLCSLLELVTVAVLLVPGISSRHLARRRQGT
jgi:peptidoglycan biosynthesis protein MviN/MurJ (putative lipid II flippase)